MESDNNFNIFISSTFREDLMKQTRSAFRNEINAQLNNIVGLLGGNAYIFDLQLGVPEGTDALKTLEICFDKIKQSDFFVFILGEEYGTNVKVFLSGHAPLDYDKYPYGETIRKGDEDKLFIIELEVIEAEKNPRLRSRRIFFFDKKSDDEVSKRIKSCCVSDDIVQEYSVAEDIKQEFVAYFQNLLTESTSNLDEEQKNRNLFYAGMLRYNVKNAEGIALLDNYLNDINGGGRKILAICGPSGSGKSTLLADWLKDKPNAVSYHVGAKGNSLQEMLSELYQWHWPDQPEVRGGDEKRLTEHFYEFLCALVANGKGLVVIDGMNQLVAEKISDIYAWLPHQLPEGMKLVISTTDTVSEKIFMTCPTPQVDLLEILKCILQREGKELETDTIAQAIKDSSFSDEKLPILANLLYHEIVENVDYGDIKTKLTDHLNSAGDILSLYKNLLYRMEKRFGETMVCDTMTMLWCSKGGLRSEDLHGIIAPTEPQKLDELMNMLYHEFSRDSLSRMRFFHTQLSTAVEELYCKKTNNTLARNKIIEYMNNIYESKGQDWCLIEIAQQLFALGDSERMEAILSHFRVAATLYFHNTTMFAQYFLMSNNHDELPFIWESVVDQCDYWEVSFIAFYFQRIGEFFNARQWRSVALRLAEKTFGPNHYETAKTNNTIGYLCQQKEDFEQALQYHKAALKICESLGGDSYSYTGLTLDEIGKDYLSMNEFEEAEHWLKRALSVIENTLGGEHLYAARTYNDMLLLHQKLYYAEKRDAEMMRRTLKSIGIYSPESEYDINDFMRETVHLDEAVQWGLRAIKAYESANKFGFPDPETVIGHFNLSKVYYEKCEYKNAYEHVKKAAYLIEQLREEDDPFRQEILAVETRMSVMMMREIMGLEISRDPTVQNQYVAEATGIFEQWLFNK